MLFAPSYLKVSEMDAEELSSIIFYATTSPHDLQGSVFRLFSPISTSLHLPDFLPSSMYLIPKCADRQAYTPAFATNVSGNIVKMRKNRKSLGLALLTLLLSYIISPPETSMIKPARVTHRSSQTSLTGDVSTNRITN
jgi:hypothetical protein